MWYHNGAAHDIGYSKNFIYLVGIYTGIKAFAEVVFDTIVATQYHTGHQAQHFLCFYIQGAIGVGIG
jgi:hypothetical protein